MARVKVLYVEDELFLGKIVRESLESRDYEVVMVSHGNEVLKAFEKHTFDICILDIMLPGKDGLSLAKEIRLLNPEIPIIFLTAKSRPKIWYPDLKPVAMIIYVNPSAWKN